MITDPKVLSLMGIGIEFISLLGALITVWVTINSKISVLETKVTHINKEIDEIKQDLKELLRRT